jgi:hypothetical protein
LIGDAVFEDLVEGAIRSFPGKDQPMNGKLSR